jgi:hypothetical protein
VQPGQPPLSGQRLDVAAHGDGGDAQLLRQFRDAQTASPAHDLQHPFVALIDMRPHPSSSW